MPPRTCLRTNPFQYLLSRRTLLPNFKMVMFTDYTTILTPESSIDFIKQNHIMVQQMEIKPYTRQTALLKYLT